MFFELKGWDSLINLEEIIHVDLCQGSHKFVEIPAFFGKSTWYSDLQVPLLRIWYKGHETPFKFQINDAKYEVHQSRLSPVYNQQRIKEYLEKDYNELCEVYDKIKEAIYVYNAKEEDQSEDTPEDGETLH